MTTMLETLNETVAAYTYENRAISDDGNSCRYYIDGRCCAVGRCLENPVDFQSPIMSVATLDERHTLESILKPEYRGFPLEFWEALQGLHDTTRNWDDKGLTDWGRRVVVQIKEEFKL